MAGEVHSFLDAEEWNLEDMRSVLQQDASGINNLDGDNQVPLIRVLGDKRCSAGIVKLLLNFGARIPDSKMKFLLPNFIFSGVCKNKAEVINVLLKAGACTSHDSVSTLCIAIQYMVSDDIIKVLLNAGLLNKCIHHFCFPLICATDYVGIPVRLSVFQLLLEAGADPNVKSTYDGRTPLHKVLGMTSYEPDAMLAIIELLIESGAQIDAADDLGNTPLHSAITYYHETYPCVVECLLKKGSPVDARNNCGQTPLEVAVTQVRNTEIIELLLSAGTALGMKRHSALQEVVKIHGWEPIAGNRLKTFFKYFLLEDVFSLSEFDSLISGLYDYEELSRFASECARELQKMTAISVYRGRYSLLEFVRIFTRQQVVNFNRKIIDGGVHLMKVLSDNALPLYFEVVIFKVKWFFDRKTLEEYLLYVELNTFCKGRKISLNYDSVRYIAELLPKQDLVNFVCACHNNDCFV